MRAERSDLRREGREVIDDKGRERERERERERGEERAKKTEMKKKVREETNVFFCKITSFC